jgi:quinoprotein dehydrogenase-associated probable ABC transporter substrate-binding protein
MTSPHRSLARLLVATALAGSVAFAAAAEDESLDLVSHTAFRVCADPSGLPYSNDKLQGYENKIAPIFAADLHEPVRYTWFPRTVGFVHRTLLAYRCDLVMTTVAGGAELETTNPYYRSGYMLVTRAADGITAASLSDPVFAGKRFGVIAGTPPSDMLVHHDMMPRTVSYARLVDTRYEDPGRQMLLDLADRKIDVALLWGPIAGYFIAALHLPLHAALLASEPGGPRLDYRIGMGVRHGETAWRRTLNRLIARNQAEITRILLDFHIPLLDEQNRLITAANMR